MVRPQPLWDVICRSGSADWKSVGASNGLGCKSSAFRMTTETLKQRMKRAAGEIYKRTIRDDKNWIDHWHDQGDRVKSCGVCRAFYITLEDWDRALNGADNPVDP